MGRSRSRSHSPRRARRSRSRSRSRENRRRRNRERDDSRERRRDRNRSRERSRDRSRSRERGTGGSTSTNSGSSAQPITVPPVITDKDLEGKSEAEIEMMKIMGFSGFSTTKNKVFQPPINGGRVGGYIIFHTMTGVPIWPTHEHMDIHLKASG